MLQKLRKAANANAGLLTVAVLVPFEIVAIVLSVVNNNKVTAEKVKAAQLEQEYHQKQIEFLTEGT